jgi:hypothetical protein
MPRWIEFQNNKLWWKNKFTEDFPFSFSYGYATFQEKYFGYKMAMIESNNVFMPVRMIRSKFLLMAQPLFAPLDNNACRVGAIEEAGFLNSLISGARKNKRVDRFIQPENFALFASSPDGGKCAAYGSFIVKLEGRHEKEIFGSFQPRYRSAINNAAKSGAVVHYGKSVLKQFYELNKQTLSRSSMHVEPVAYFEKLIEYLGEDSAVCATVEMDGDTLGGIFGFKSKFGFYYIYGGSADTIKASGALKFLHYSVMMKLKSEGVALYDFVGARLRNVEGKLKGIQDFKKRFGSELREGLLWKADISRQRCKVYDFMMVQKLRITGQPALRDIIDQESSIEE